MTYQLGRYPTRELIVAIIRGNPGESEVLILLSSNDGGYENSLIEFLGAEGLDATKVSNTSPDQKPQFSFSESCELADPTSWIDVLAVSAGSGGAGTALVVALQKFLDRHKDKVVKFGPDGNIRHMNGYSRKDVENVLVAAR